MSLIRLDAARVLNEVTDRAVQVHGVARSDRPHAARRMLAQARGARLYDGPDEVHQLVVSPRILTAFADGDGWRFV